MAYSETPEVLVAKGENGELSPNPAKFGFTKQEFVDSLPESGAADVLYLVKVYNDGILIGYRPYRWTPTEGYVRVFNTNTPNLKAEDGERATPVQVVNPPKEAPEKVFTGLVGFNKAPIIEGKPLQDWVDSHGGVTEEELQEVAATIPTDAHIRSIAQEEADEILDADISIQVSTDGGTTFGNPISFETWQAASNAKQYAAGTIIRFNNILKGRNLRLIATDLTHGQGTEWQFYDIPYQYVHLGLPYDFQDVGDGGAAGFQDFLDGNDPYIYPSNKHGYTSAVELQNHLKTIFQGLPYKLKRAILTTELDCYIPRICVSDDYGDVEPYSTALYVQYEGESGLTYSKTYQKLYCLSAAELGYTGNDFPTTQVYNEGGEDEETINLEGARHDYFEEGNGSSAIAKRIRYYNNEAWGYWTRSPYLPGSHGWGDVTDIGYTDGSATSSGRGVAPAFRV